MGFEFKITEKRDKNETSDCTLLLLSDRQTNGFVVAIDDSIPMFVKKIL